jgi:hypothetical protein
LPVVGSRIVRENPLFAASSLNLTADILLTSTEFTSIHCLVFKDRGSCFVAGAVWRDICYLITSAAVRSSTIFWFFAAVNVLP